MDHTCGTPKLLVTVVSSIVSPPNNVSLIGRSLKLEKYLISMFFGFIIKLSFGVFWLIFKFEIKFVDTTGIADNFVNCLELSKS